MGIVSIRDAGWEDGQYSGDTVTAAEAEVQGGRGTLHHIPTQKPTSSFPRTQESSAVGVSLVGTLAAAGVWVNHQGCPNSGDTYPMAVAGEEHR